MFDQAGTVSATFLDLYFDTPDNRLGNTMKVADIMQTPVRTVTSDTPVSEVVVSIVDAQVSGLPVVDTRGRQMRSAGEGVMTPLPSVVVSAGPED